MDSTLEDRIAELMQNPRYLQMLLGIAILALPDGLEVAREDYSRLVGLGVVMGPGSQPGTFKLSLKPLPPEQAATRGIPMVDIVGEA